MIYLFGFFQVVQHHNMIQLNSEVLRTFLRNKWHVVCPRSSLLPSQRLGSQVTMNELN